MQSVDRIMNDQLVVIMCVYVYCLQSISKDIPNICLVSYDRCLVLHQFITKSLRPSNFSDQIVRLFFFLMHAYIINCMLNIIMFTILMEVLMKCGNIYMILNVFATNTHEVIASFIAIFLLPIQFSSDRLQTTKQVHL